MYRNLMVSVSVSLATGVIATQSLAADDETPPGQPAIRLESTFTGDKEQPAVSYFIPWQGTRTPDKLQWNIENKHDGTLETVDRDVMKRSINIYQEMHLENP